MLMAEVTALGQTAHIEVVPPFLVPEMGALAANNGWRLPLALDTPAMEHGLAFAPLPTLLFSEIHFPKLFDNRTLIRIAYRIKSHYPPAVNPAVKRLHS